MPKQCMLCILLCSKGNLSPQELSCHYPMPTRHLKVGTATNVDNPLPPCELCRHMLTNDMDIKTLSGTMLWALGAIAATRSFIRDHDDVDTFALRKLVWPHTKPASHRRAKRRLNSWTSRTVLRMMPFANRGGMHTKHWKRALSSQALHCHRPTTQQLHTSRSAQCRGLCRNRGAMNSSKGDAFSHNDVPMMAFGGLNRTCLLLCFNPQEACKKAMEGVAVGA